MCQKNGRDIPAIAYKIARFCLGTLNRQALLTAVLADGINLGLTRMSKACRETTSRQLSWTADWHVREECYAQAPLPA